MDLDNIQQSMNTRVVFKEPRGMIRWLQVFFAIIAFSTVVDFNTTVGVDIKCPPINGTSLNVTEVHPKLVVTYPFDFTSQVVVNECSGTPYDYKHIASLNGSPQFFVMTGILSLMYASASLVVYMFFSSTYESLPVMSVADLIVTAILCLFWFIASSSFSSGVSLLKSTANYAALEQGVCPSAFKTAGAVCTESDYPSWKSLNVALVSGFTSFFLWGSGLWFVYKETHFHTPRDQFGPR